MTATEVDARVSAHAEKFGGRAADMLIMDDKATHIPGVCEEVYKHFIEMARLKAAALPAPSKHVIKGGLPSVTSGMADAHYLDGSPLVTALARMGHGKASAAVLKELRTAYAKGYKDAMDTRITISPTPVPTPPSPLKCEYNITAKVFQFNDGVHVPEKLVQDKRMLESMHLSKAHLDTLAGAYAAIHKHALVFGAS